MIRPLVDGLRQDLRDGWRSRRARPGFTLVTVLTLALGVGANTAIFSAVNALLLRSLPVGDTDRVVYGMSLREGFDPFGTSFLEYTLFRDEARSLARSGLGTPRLFTLLGSGEPERLRGSAVMTGYLKTLGVQPALGRLFTDDEDRAGGPAVALIGHEVWQRRFAGDRGVLGRRLTLEDRWYSIVGAMPRGFDMPYSAEVRVPMQVSPDSLPLDLRAANANELVARLKPGVRLEQADAELKTLARRLEQEYPQIRRNWSYGIVPLRWQLLADLEGRTQRSLGAVAVAVGFLLLICCANVASLLLARGVTREGEIAVRRALGAGRMRLVRQLLAESLLLALLGGAAGVAAAVWIQPLLRALNPIQAVGLGAYLNDFRIDARVLLFSLALTLLTGVVSGVAPALRAARGGDPIIILKRDHRASAGARGRRGLRALVVGEIAVAATLLVGAGLMVQSFGRLQRTDLGFHPDGLLTMELPLSPARHAGTAQQTLFMERVLDRVGAVPGVVAAAMTLNVPMQRGVTLDSVFEVEGRAPASPGEVPITAHRLVSPGYMETLGVSLVAGRFLRERDRAGAPAVVVVSEELVRQAWPGQDPLGKRVRRLRAGVRGPWMSVGGVVRDVKEDRFGFRIHRPVWYVPYAQQTFAVPVSLPLNLVVRAAADPGAVASGVRRAVHAVDPAQPVASVMPMKEYLADVLAGDRFSAVLMATLAGAWTLTRLLSSALYHVSPTDPATFGLVTLLLAGIALLAAWFPARRATRISPIEALRSE